MLPSQKPLSLYGFLLVILLAFLHWNKFVNADFSLACNPGYRLSAIRRVNSAHQRDKVGSIAIECQPILSSGFAGKHVEAKCEPLDSAPECNGQPEGCSGNQWLGGFNVYKIQNGTNASLLDPICCASPSIQLDMVSCASERLNVAKQPFEHSIASSDFVYRGLKCWHQYEPEGAALDLIWKMEICQIVNQKWGNGTDQNSENCPPCECHCGINLCGNGDEPIRVIHKHFLPNKKCACECICRYECIE